LLLLLVQSKLLNASEGLLQQSQGMTALMELLLHYQHSGTALLNSLHASSTTLQDMAFYAICLSIPLIFFTHPPDARVLLLATVLVAWFVEKATLQHVMSVHHVLTAGVAGAAAGSPAYVHTVKLVVRLGVLGGGLGLVLWMLLKRHAAQQKKEELFQELKRSVRMRREQQQQQQHWLVAADAALSNVTWNFMELVQHVVQLLQLTGLCFCTAT
jgi:hypothetical protein